MKVSESFVEAMESVRKKMANATYSMPKVLDIHPSKPK